MLLLNSFVHEKMAKRLCELFCGTKSIGREAEALGWDVVSVDLREDFEPSICCDLLDFDYKAAWSPGEFIWVHASPPCSLYSIAAKHRDVETANKLTRRAKEIIEYLNAPYITIENPQSSIMWKQAIFPWKTHLTNYCKYTDPEDETWGYKKPTTICTTIPNLRLQVCKKDCANTVMFEGRKLHRESAQRGGSHFTPKGVNIQKKYHTQEELYRIPALLCREIVLAIEADMK